MDTRNSNDPLTLLRAEKSLDLIAVCLVLNLVQQPIQDRHAIRDSTSSDWSFLVQSLSF